MKPKTEAKIGLRFVPLGDLVRWPRNPKNHDLPRIRASILRHGFVLPLVEDENSGKLVAGHGRLEVLEALHAEGAPPPKRIQVKKGKWLVPVLSGVSFPDEASAEAYLLADNRLVELGGWDAKELLSFLDTRTPEFVKAEFAWAPAEVLRMQNELGGTNRGASPTDLLPRFQSAAIKQIVLYFSAAQFTEILGRLSRVSASLGVDNNTDVFRRLLDYHDKNYKAARPAPRTKPSPARAKRA